MHDALDVQALSAAARSGQPEAQYRLGALYFSRGEIAAALDWLNRAAAMQVPDAQNLLGVICLNGIGIPCAPHTAAKWFTQAASHDLKEAHYNLAGLLFSNSAVPNDDSAAVRHLLRAAGLHHRAALRVLGYLYRTASDPALQIAAGRCFAQAAMLGDPHAEYVLGMDYLRGTGRDRNPGTAGYWLNRALQKHIYCAKSALQSIRNEMGDTEFARVVQEPVREAERRADPPFELHDRDINSIVGSGSEPIPGKIYEYPDRIHADLSDYLVNLAAPQLAPSAVVDPGTGQGLTSVLRTSSSMNFPLSRYDLAVGLVCRNLAGLVNVPSTHAEPLSVLRYLPGEEYKPHYDHFAVDAAGAPQVQDRNGQRRATVFAYLSDVEAGGETDFPRLAVKVAPAKGKAVAFLNCDARGRPDPDTLHAGCPVRRGEKWLATLWFRERPFLWQ